MNLIILRLMRETVGVLVRGILRGKLLRASGSSAAELQLLGARVATSRRCQEAPEVRLRNWQRNVESVMEFRQQQRASFIQQVCARLPTRLRLHVDPAGAVGWDRQLVRHLVIHLAVSELLHSNNGVN